MKNKFIQLVEDGYVKKEAATFAIGDTVDVHLRILDGDKERIQIFNGVVISKRGDGMRESFTVRRIVQSEGVERTFPVNSPKIAKIEVKRTGAVRRAKLYYLRDRVGKATRLRERRKGTGAEGTGLAEGKTKKAKAQSSVATEEKTGSQTSR